MHVRLGRRMGALVSVSPRPEDPHPNPLPRGEGGRAAAASRTPGVYKSLRRRRAGVPVRVAGDVARLLGPAATLTPTLSLKGEGGRGGSVWVRRLRGSPLTLALSRTRDRCLTGGGWPEDPHPNPLPRGEGGRAAAALWKPGVFKSLRRRRAGVPARVAGDVARLLGPAATLTPTLSLKGEGGRGGSAWVRWLRGRSLTPALSRRRDRCLTGGGCPEDAQPNPRPLGEGVEQPDVFDEGSGGA